MNVKHMSKQQLKRTRLCSPLQGFLLILIRARPQDCKFWPQQLSFETDLCETWTLVAVVFLLSLCNVVFCYTRLWPSGYVKHMLQHQFFCNASRYGVSWQSGTSCLRLLLASQHNYRWDLCLRGVCVCCCLFSKATSCFLLFYSTPCLSIGLQSSIAS